MVNHLRDLLLALAGAALLSPLVYGQINSTPIQRSGPSCPIGYYRQGNYCTPSAGVGQQNQAIPKEGSSCPWGWYSAGAYCTRRIK